MEELSESTQKKLNETCKKIYRLLQIQGFGRIDLRIKNDEIYFIEANPNPSIAKKEDYEPTSSDMFLVRLVEKIKNLFKMK